MVGRAALMRVSSVICWFESRGTLKSTRTKTRFPARSMSRIVFLSISLSLRERTARSLKAFFGDKVCEIGNATGVTPLVIVPCDDLDHVTADNHRRESINNRGMGFTPEIGRNKR